MLRIANHLGETSGSTLRPVSDCHQLRDVDFQSFNDSADALT